MHYNLLERTAKQRAVLEKERRGQNSSPISKQKPHAYVEEAPCICGTHHLVCPPESSGGIQQGAHVALSGTFFIKGPQFLSRGHPPSTAFYVEAFHPRSCFMPSRIPVRSYVPLKACLCIDHHTTFIGNKRFQWQQPGFLDPPLPIGSA